MHPILLDDNNESHLTDIWRAHHGEMIDVCPPSLHLRTLTNLRVITGQVEWVRHGPSYGSIGDDLELKIWEENSSQPEHSGHRFTCAYR
jgi:hypothetical protein